MFAIFTLLIVVYVMFAGGLWGFHGYLLIGNVTTREIMEKGKCWYLKGVRGNPFN